MMLRALSAFVAICALALMPLTALAEEFQQGRWTNTYPPSAAAIGGWANPQPVVWKFDADGVGYTTEAYPSWQQTDAQPLASFSSPVSIHAGLKQVGNAWSAAPFLQAGLLWVQRVSTGTNGSDPTYIYLFSGNDLDNLKPMTTKDAWQPGLNASAADTAKCDTVRCILPAGTGGQTFNMRIPLPDGYPGRYVAAYAKRDSSSGTAQTLSLQWEGRVRQ